VRRFLILAVSACSLTATQVAMGAPPSQERITVADVATIPGGTLCPFPIEFRATGKVLVTTHFNGDGSVDFISERPNITITLTNPANGKVLTDRDVGLDKRVFNPDGTSDVLSTGIHARVKAPGGGVIFRQIGLQIIHLDANGEPISVEIVGGNFDSPEAFQPAVCGALA